ncbi:MAG: glycosyltransferase [Calothrix sp. MO_192.B10]|nr:glycosyltransferase [Calothrix sp. MO_192.B10]
MVKVTVLMAIYNGQDYLREAVDSILAQTFQDFEFLIINDGSTDSTREIICSYHDPRIRLIHNEHNLGLTRSLNKGWELAKGEFIARQDADDISEPERLAKQVAFLETHSEVALVGTWFKNIDPQGSLIGEYDLPCDSTEIRWEILFYSPFVHSAVMFRKDIISEQIGLYNEAFSYAQDYDLWWRISRRFKVANIKDYLIKLRVNPSSMTATYGNVVDDEPILIQMTNIGHLLGQQKVKKWSNGILLKRMTSLWLAETGSLSYELPEELKDLKPRQFNKVVRQILHLHNTFCRHYKLNQEEEKKHHQEVCTYLSNRLLAIAYYYLEKNKYTARQFLSRAYCLKYSIWSIDYWNIRLNPRISFEIMR